MIAEWMVRYYDKPRNRLQCVLGAIIITPTIKRIKKELSREEKEIAEKTILLGRLELTNKLLQRWWDK